MIGCAVVPPSFLELARGFVAAAHDRLSPAPSVASICLARKLSGDKLPVS